MFNVLKYWLVKTQGKNLSLADSCYLPQVFFTSDSEKDQLLPSRSSRGWRPSRLSHDSIILNAAMTTMSQLHLQECNSVCWKMFVPCKRLPYLLMHYYKYRPYSKTGDFSAHLLAQLLCSFLFFCQRQYNKFMCACISVARPLCFCVWCENKSFTFLVSHVQ